MRLLQNVYIFPTNKMFAVNCVDVRITLMLATNIFKTINKCDNFSCIWLPCELRNSDSFDGCKRFL